MKIGILAAITTIFVAGMAGGVSAAVVNHVITTQTTGSPDPAVLDITIDTSLFGVGSGLTSGLTINGTNFAVDSVIGYDTFALNVIIVYGFADGLIINGVVNDFFVTLTDWGTTSATANGITLSQAGQGFISSFDSGGMTVNELVSPVPVPATLPLLVFSVSGLGLMMLRKRKAALQPH